MKRNLRVIVIVASLISTFAWAKISSAQSYVPARNSVVRSNLLNQARQIIIRELGAPVELYVKEIKVSGNYAFVRVEPKRPGNRDIDMRRTPRVARHGILTLEAFDCCHTEVIFQKRNNRWHIVDKSVGSTDLWIVSYCDKTPEGLIEACKYEAKR